ncbi:MAG: ABC transporter substrate-binding protein [Acidimicrobiales bacterium]
MTDRIDRRSFLARGAATGAGIALAGGAGGLLAACGSSSSSPSTTSRPTGISSATPKSGGTLVIGTDTEEKGFSPTKGTYDQVGIMYARTVFDPLMILDATGTPQPYLAQSVTHNATYTAWTITLRPNLVFHNGTPCDATALQTNFQLHKKSILTAPAITTIDSVTVTGPLTCVVNMASPWVPFDYYLAGGIGSQFAYVAEPAWLASGSQTNPIGTGPFVFQTWIPNDHFTATKNPHYWRPGLPYLDSVTYRPIIDSTQLYQSLQSGVVDLIASSSSTEVTAPLRSNTALGFQDDVNQTIGEHDMDCVLLNLSKPPFDNPKVRQAAAMAISSPEYVKVIGGGIEVPSNGPFSQGSPFWVPDNPYPAYNPSKASALVKQVEHQTGQPISFVLGQVPGPGTTQEAEFIQAQLKAVGIQATLSTVQQANIINDALLGNFQGLVWRQFGAVTPDVNYIFWSPTQINSVYSINMARNADPRMQTALILGRQATTKSGQTAAYQQVGRLMGEDIPYLWLGQTVWSLGANAKVIGYRTTTTPAGQPAQGFFGGYLFPTQLWLD